MLFSEFWNPWLSGVTGAFSYIFTDILFYHPVALPGEYLGGAYSVYMISPFRMILYLCMVGLGINMWRRVVK